MRHRSRKRNPGRKANSVSDWLLPQWRNALLHWSGHPVALAGVVLSEKRGSAGNPGHRDHGHPSSPARRHQRTSATHSPSELYTRMNCVQNGELPCQLITTGPTPHIPAPMRKRLIPERVMTQAWKKRLPSPSKARKSGPRTGILQQETQAPIRMPRRTVKTVVRVMLRNWGSTQTRQMCPILKSIRHTRRARVTTRLHDRVHAPMADGQFLNRPSALKPEPACDHKTERLDGRPCP